MINSTIRQTSPCIVEGIQPLLTELPDPIQVGLCDERNENRHTLEQFIHDVFARAYDANVQSFYPNLLTFSTDQRIRGAVGYRDGMVQPLFSENYLDGPADRVLARLFQQPVARHHMIEVGNLAMNHPGEARWVIAAVTLHLYTAGYRWVLFTAVKSLFNAFQRLGVNPVQIAQADPQRMPEGGRNWGRYYEANPVVCAGDIEAGYKKLSAFISPRQPKLHSLLQQARLLGMNSRYGDKIRAAG